MANPSTSTAGVGTSRPQTTLQSKNLKGKRKKAVPANANPLFTKWLTEWKEEAALKGWKSQYNYSKALKTLKMFPLCLESGKDCKLLQNFGDKTCKMLDEKLAEYKQNKDKGLEDEDPRPASSVHLKPVESAHHSYSNNVSGTRIHAISDNSDSGKDETTSPEKKKQKKSVNSRPREYVPGYRSGTYAIILTMHKYSLYPDYKGFLTKAELIHAAQPLSDKSFTIPDVGSHYTAWSSMGSLIKKGLISKDGSPARYSLTQNGFDLGERLQNAGTGENGSPTGTMNSDRREERLLSPNSPSRPTKNLDHLDHLNLSAREKEFISEGLSQDLSPCTTTSFPVGKPVDDTVYVVSDDEGEIDSGSQWSCHAPSKAHSLSLSPPSSPGTCITKELDLSYVKSSDTVNALDMCENINDSICVMDYKENEVESDNDEMNLGISQQDPHKRLRLPSLSPPPFSLNKFDDDVIEIDDDDDDIDNKLSDNAKIKSIFNETDSRLSQNSDSDDVNKKSIFTKFSHQLIQNPQSDDEELPDLDFGVPLSKRLLDQGTVKSQLLLSHFNKECPTPDSNEIYCNATEKCNSLPLKQNSQNVDNVISKGKVHEPSNPFTSISAKVQHVSQIQKIDKNCNTLQSSLPTATERPVKHGVKGHMDTRPIPEFTLLPGSFEIVLCVDNREFYGSKSNSKTLLPDLLQSGVNCDLRLLHIGDIIWIAREKVSPEEETSRTDRKELVLNFAIERKRMDDLVSSMTGGRLKEQKFRLRHCGVSELIILIEEYGSIQNFSISEDRIKQGIVNSQILDGFKVKRCGSSKEAVRYLTLMTRFIKKYYGNKTLHAASHEIVKDIAPKSTVKDDEYFLMAFETFNETSVKHKALTVKEMFGKQLIQIPGVSLERACAITKVYPTPTLLMKAYENCTTEKLKESLLSTIKCGSKERNLGIAISRMLYMLYNTTKLS